MLRSLNLPEDFSVVFDLTVNGFQYPENDNWSVQADSKDGMVDTVKAFQRLWPVIAIARRLSPGLRDHTLGFVWEEAQKPAGLVLVRRLGKQNWEISSVVVLPAYRRQGIGRKLVQASIDFIRQRGGKVALIAVVDGNTPAHALYEQMGFQSYGGEIEFDCSPDGSPAESSLPEQYTLSPLSLLDWRTRYELEQRIAPVEVQRYEPVEEASFHNPITNIVFQTAWRLAGFTGHRFGVYSPDGQAVAWGGTTVRTRPGGVNSIQARLDPSYRELASFLLNHLIYSVRQCSPGRRIKFVIPEHQSALIEAAQAVGSVQRLRCFRLGMFL